MKELAAAWEDVQLTASENGGLDLAEAATERLTEALRYLSENFTEIEEVVERVAHALTVYLVGKGITLAIAHGIAMRAAYIELAGAVSGVGTALSRAIGPLVRMGVAARVLVGTLGGPLGLAVTAASLLSLGLNFDSTADKIQSADTATDKAATALSEYREAVRLAKEEQEGLGEALASSNEGLAEQTRQALQKSLTELTNRRKELVPQIDVELENVEFSMRNDLQQSPGIVDLADFFKVPGRAGSLCQSLMPTCNVWAVSGLKCPN